MATVYSRSVLGTAVQVVVLLLLLSVLAGVVLVLFAVLSVVRAPGQVANNLTSEASRALGSAQQTLQNVTDPNHPPSGLSYDTEFASLTTWQVGQRLPDASQYALSLQAIHRRDGADSPDTAQYAVIHAELKQPRETRLLGQLVRSDSDPHDFIVYKGEAFRIARTIYRVNWISQETASMAAGVYRHPDSVSAALKFDYD